MVSLSFMSPIKQCLSNKAIVVVRDNEDEDEVHHAQHSYDLFIVR